MLENTYVIILSIIYLSLWKIKQINQISLCQAFVGDFFLTKTKSYIYFI